MDAADLAALERTLTAEGADAAIDRLCAKLRADKDHSGLFYALLLRARHRIGVNPVPIFSVSMIAKTTLGFLR